MKPKRAKVLVIDDDPITLEVVRERLEGAGFEVLLREEALGTLQAVREEKPDVVLLDVMMPALNGERIAELLRKSRSTASVNIILHSSKSQAELAAIIKDTGAIGAITKTSDDAQFIVLFEDLLRERRPSTPVN